MNHDLVADLEKHARITLAGLVADRKFSGLWPSELQVAKHEAAHATTRWLYQEPIYSASIIPDAFSRGRVLSTSPEERTNEVPVLWSADFVRQWKPQRDRRRVLAFLTMAHGEMKFSALRAHWHRLWGETEALLSGSTVWWDVISSLGDELYLREEMSGNEIDQFIRNRCRSRFGILLADGLKISAQVGNHPHPCLGRRSGHKMCASPLWAQDLVSPAGQQLPPR